MNRRLIRGLIAGALMAVVARSGEGAAAKKACIQAAELRSANERRGGHNMFLTPAREIWMQIVEPAKGKLVDRRFRGPAAAADLAELRQIVTEAQFMKMKDAERPEAPGENVWRASVTTCDGRTHVVRQPAQDLPPGFERLVAWFQRVGGATVTGSPQYEGTPDFAWKPPAKKAP
jgi:hypothetical protein